MKNSIWISEESAPDTHAAFRASFKIPHAARVEIRTVGSAWYRGWLDGAWVLEGPLRYALNRPEYDVHQPDLAAGRHVLAFHVHHIGLNTRILANTPPFIWCRIFAGGEEMHLEWRAIRLPGYRATLRRINPQLGWIENCLTAKNPADWQLPGFDDANWPRPDDSALPLPEPEKADLANIQRMEIPLRQIAGGTLATTFIYPDDDPSTTFFLRDLNPVALPALGQWRRYDLGRIRLGSPELIVEAPSGTILEIACSEYLVNGRVSPWIAGSTGLSCNFDRYVLFGGRQVIAPLTPKGGRFVEVHVVNHTETIFHGERFHERGYHQRTQATFECGDPLLEKIWVTGVETYRACTEDALIDNPTRERGQWIGDVSSVGIDIAAVAYHDLRLCKRALEQAALCSREDGLVAGLCPGGCEYLPTYAFQWVVAAVNYHRNTGDRELMANLYPAAVRNLAAIEAFLQEDGLRPVAGWNFIDWGYKNEEPVDLASNLHYLWALRAMIQWSRILRLEEGYYHALALRMERAVRSLIATRLEEGWDRLGYHCSVLAASLGLLPENQRGEALAYLKRHLLACFPNNPHAPRNDDPTAYNRQLITPYFAHYAFPLLIEAGEMDFVLGQYRHCWGWSLKEDRTTWLEVFDTRWSHCHAWAGCPTWQLSRYLSGLHPRPGTVSLAYDWKFHPGSLEQASLRIPHPAEKEAWITIEWKRQADGLHYRLETPVDIILHGLPGDPLETRVSGKLERRFAI